MSAERRLNVVDHDTLCCRVDNVVVAEREPDDAADRAIALFGFAVPELVERVAEVNVVVVGELRVDGEADQASLAIRADAVAQIECSRILERTISVDIELTVLRRDQQPAIGHDGERRWSDDRCHALVGESVAHDHLARLRGDGCRERHQRAQYGRSKSNDA